MGFVEHIINPHKERNWQIECHENATLFAVNEKYSNALREKKSWKSFLTPILFRAVSSLHRSLAEKATACGLFLRLTDSFTRCHKADLLLWSFTHPSTDNSCSPPQWSYPILLCKVPIFPVDQVPRRWSIMLARAGWQGNNTRVRCRSVNCAIHTTG